MGVWLLSERFGVTVAMIAAFVVLVLTGHMTSEYLAVFGPLLGLIGAAWFSSHQAAQQAANAQQQAAQPAAGKASKVGGFS